MTRAYVCMKIPENPPPGCRWGGVEWGWGEWRGLRGGGTLNFSTYVGSDLASTLHLDKISGILSTPKKYLKF